MSHTANLIKFSSKLWQANAGSLALPFKLNFVVTKECHSHCQNCNIWQTKPHNELTLAEVVQIAEHNPFLSWINFTGGEPTDRPDIVEVVRAFVASCQDLFLINLTTNGLKPERIVDVARAIKGFWTRSLVMTVSIDGPPKVNDVLRGVRGDFEAAIRTLTALSAIPGIKTMVGMTLYPQNFRLIDATVAAIQQHKPDFNYRDLHINLPHLSAHYYGNDRIKGSWDVRDLKPVLEDYVRKRGLPQTPLDWVERRFHNLAPRYLAEGKTPIDCAALLSSCFLSETGDLLPCSIWDEKLGNVRESNYQLAPLLSTPKADELKELISQKSCPNCWTPCEAFPSMLSKMVQAVGVAS